MISMKDAKTGQEMLDSWQNLVGDGDIEDIKAVFKVYAEKMPQLLEYFTNKPLLSSLERGALDPKTRELDCYVGCQGMRSWCGLPYPGSDS